MRNFFLIVVLLLLVLPGCRIGGERSVSEENDRLRRLVHDQEDQIKALSGERDELKVKLTEANKSGVSSDVLDATPRLTEIQISALSGLTPNDRGVSATGFVIYLSPRDGRGRFVQVVGSLTAEVLALPEKVEEASQAKRVAILSLTPPQVRDAYRSNITGTHYTIEVPFQAPLARGSSVLVRVEFSDAITGEHIKAERVVSPVQPRPTPPKQ